MINFLKFLNFYFQIFRHFNICNFIFGEVMKNYNIVSFLYRILPLKSHGLIYMLWLNFILGLNDKFFIFKYLCKKGEK